MPSEDGGSVDPAAPGPILIIGAGCSGLSLAQGLKKSGIESVVFDKDDAPSSRSRDWNFSLHWAVPTLRSLVPPEVFSRIESTQVDPSGPPPSAEILKMVNGQTGEELRSIPIPGSFRMRRSKLKALISEGIDVQYKKKLRDISYSEDEYHVTAHFEDGTTATGSLLVGADGSRSSVREMILGHKQAALNPIPYAASFVQAQYTREQALFLRQSFRLFIAAIHPVGLFSWFGLHDVPDPAAPETWTFYTYISYPVSMEDQASSANWTNEMKMKHLKDLAKDFAEPWRSAYAWMPDDQPVWRHGMTSWDPSEPEHQWDSKKGRTTLIGDAAHPMTYQRGQALNHAVTDAAQLTEALASYTGKSPGITREDAIAAYVNEMMKRAGEEVRVCDENTRQLHNWDEVRESPVMKSGLSSLHKS